MVKSRLMRWDTYVVLAIVSARLRRAVMRSPRGFRLAAPDGIFVKRLVVLMSEVSHGLEATGGGVNIRLVGWNGGGGDGLTIGRLRGF
jgi:hypothetical protein